VTNQAKVGIFAFITIVIFILGFYFLKGINLFSTKNRYYATYSAVDGIYKSSPVLINGYRIGIVSDLFINPKSGEVVIEMLSENDFPNTYRLAR
jgi:phospholipid/cholesterol/gamma-HCH transport system substrate-binding protein